MIRLPPRSTRSDTLFPYTTLVRSRLVVLEVGFDDRPQAAPAAEEHRDIPGPRGFFDVANPHRVRRPRFLAALAADDDEIGLGRMRQRFIERQPEALAVLLRAAVGLHDAAQRPQNVAGPPLALLDVDRAEHRPEAADAEHPRRQIRRGAGGERGGKEG